MDESHDLIDYSLRGDPIWHITSKETKMSYGWHECDLDVTLAHTPISKEKLSASLPDTWIGATLSRAGVGRQRDTGIEFVVLRFFWYYFDPPTTTLYLWHRIMQQKGWRAP